MSYAVELAAGRSVRISERGTLREAKEDAESYMAKNPFPRWRPVHEKELVAGEWGAWVAGNRRLTIRDC